MNKLTKALYTVAMVLASCVGLARGLPVSAADPACVGYDTAQGAAVAALNRAAAITEKKEFAGVVYALNGSYCYTVAVTNDSNHAFNIKAIIPAGGRLVALYHTHPKGNDSRDFSPDDVETARAMKVMSYIGVLSDNSIRVLDGATDTTPRLASAHGKEVPQS